MSTAHDSVTKYVPHADPEVVDAMPPLSLHPTPPSW